MPSRSPEDAWAVAAPAAASTTKANAARSFTATQSSRRVLAILVPVVKLSARSVCARLRAVAAELHRAPRRLPRRRVVVERPAAVAARLQTAPRAVEHRAEGGRDDPVECVTLGGRRRHSVRAELEWDAGGSPVEHVDRVLLEREAVVREDQRAQRRAEPCGPRPLRDKAP